MSNRHIVFSANKSWFVYNFYKGLISKLLNLGFEVSVVAPSDESVDELKKMSCRCYDIKIDSKGSNPLYDLLTIVRYYLIFRKIKPNVVFNFTIKPNMYSTVASSLLGIKAVNTVTGLGTAFISQSFSSKMVKFLYKMIQPLAEKVYVLNGDDYKLLLDSKLVPVDKIEKVPGSGLDIARFVPVAKIPNSKFRFLYIGRILYDKGLGELIDAVRLLKTRGLDFECHWRGFLGAENRTAISNEQVKNWEAEGLISFLGPSDDVRPDIAECDCVVLPSYREGLPQSLLEAMAMERPVIATDVPGCRDLVRKGENGFLCDSHSAESLALEMEKMMAISLSKREGMGVLARDFVVSEFSTEQVYGFYVKHCE